MGGNENAAIDVGLQPYGTILRNLSRSWLIERSPRDDRDDFAMRELGKRARESEGGPTEAELTDSVIGQIFRTIWSRREGSKDWRDDWASFPL